MKKVNLLWTGGFDSTFRLCQLSRMEDVEVQPIYFCFRSVRANEKREKEAQAKILPILRSKPETKATILNPIYFEEKNLPKDPEAEAAFEKWKVEKHVPMQNRWLCRLALVFPKIEIGREGPTLKHRHDGYRYGKTRTWLMSHGVQFRDYPDGASVPDFTHAEPGLDLLFGRFSYPILGIPETQMAVIIHQWGYEDLFKMTWSCDEGHETPCGICSNCQTKWDSGLKDFFAPDAVRNHEIDLYLKNIAKSHDFYVNRGDLDRLFEKYIRNGYKYDTSLELIMAPMNQFSKLLFDIRKRESKEIQDYFDFLILNWDAIKEGKISVTKNQFQCG